MPPHAGDDPGQQDPRLWLGVTAWGGHRGGRNQTSSQHATAPRCLPGAAEHSCPCKRLRTDPNSSLPAAGSQARPRRPQQAEGQSEVHPDNSVLFALKQHERPGREAARRHLHSREDGALRTGRTRQDPGSGPSWERSAGHLSERDHPADTCPLPLPAPTQGTLPAGQPRRPRSVSCAGANLSRVKWKRRSGRDADGGGDGLRGGSVPSSSLRRTNTALNPHTK